MTAARVKYPAALQCCKFDTLLLAAGSLIVERNTVRIVNSAVYAMQVLQQEMEKDAERAGLNSEDDVMDLVKELRKEDEFARGFCMIRIA
ncbi:MAG: hypothetical protein K2P65_12410 [Lachnospiraceae bacterium]|nr:hypothetical protein [Lachnospiraceae bacterium]